MKNTVKPDSQSILNGLRNIRFEAMNRVAKRTDPVAEDYFCLSWRVPAYLLLDVAVDMRVDPMTVLHSMEGHVHVIW